MRRVIECVANFSEGRNPAIVDAIVESIARGHGVVVLDRTMDADHNRSVITFVGSPDTVAAAAVRAVAKAAELIDLNRHSGVHPRLGAADVVPFVPVEDVTLDECAAIAHAAGEEIWATCGVPVYFYEAAALHAERIRLENVRRGQFEGVRAEVLANPARRPDIGGPGLHPTAGAVIVGARKYLIACNVNLATQDLGIAKSIARSIRTSSGGFPHVKALGLPLATRKQVQVSINLTDYEVTPLHVIYDAIRSRAAAAGVDITDTEIIGMIPRAAVEQAAASALRIADFRPDFVLETRIAHELPFGIDDLLENLQNPSRATGGGSAASLAGAMAASLGILVCRLMKTDPSRFHAEIHFFSAAIARDAEAFAALMRTTDPPPEAIEQAARVPLDIAEHAAALLRELEDLCRTCAPRFSSDAITARGLAAAARDGAVATVKMNLASIDDAGVRSEMEGRLRALK